MRILRRMLLAALLLAAIAWAAQWWLAPRVEPGSVLWLTVEGNYRESAESLLLSEVLGIQEQSLAGLLSQMRKAERDARLDHVVIHLRNLEIGWAKAQEIRAALISLRESGRHVIAFLEVPGFGANREYYVATAAEDLRIAPGGGPPLLGLSQEYIFLGGLWDRLGIRVEVSQAGEFKGAVEAFTGREMTDGFRAQASALLDSLDAQFRRGIQEGRGLDARAVETALLAAPSDGEALQQLGLVDGVITRAALLAELGDPPVVDGSTYAAVDPAELGFEPEATFALVYGSGAIVAGEGSISPSGQPVLAADTVVAALEAAAEDDAISAIVLRINSPGGGSYPSELVWRAVREARRSKPVVASFSDYAASGGYYLATAAEAVVANPATLTGSIGVYAVRPALGGLLDRIDIGSDALLRGPHAEILLATPELSEDTRGWLQAEVEVTYRRFRDRVADGRELKRTEVDAVAEGRVFTGEQALERRLVDSLGGLRAAVSWAKQRVGLDPDADVALEIYPRPRSWREQLRTAFHQRVARTVRQALPWGEAAAGVATWVDALGAGGPVLVPPFWIEVH